ncbi:MAG: iron-containing alcohol dehydrogenase [Bacteroidota bacterium]|nr:iron-containing alcohol dehydrogenase [Bacteroidota bacterium]
MNTVIINNPSRLVFGAGSLQKMADDYLALGLKRLFVLTIPSITDQLTPVFEQLKSNGVTIQINTNISREPSFSDLETILAFARTFNADSVAGIGGGSVLDVAKLVAAQLHNDQPLQSIVGNGLLKGRSTYLACLPTTSGTGSEVSPNAILLDETDGAKKGIISPFLVPDGAYIDPALTLRLPPYVTAFTGIDALTHCIEAYTNRFAHPMVDTFALEGIKLIGRNLKKAVDNGQDLEARSAVALGSVYGGMCLGPVNTAAVHALAYPLGSEYKIAHGVSNALLLPYIMEFNLPEAEAKYAEIARAMGAQEGNTDRETALNGIELVRKLISDCGIPAHLSEINIPFEDIEAIAQSALGVQRLLKNNIREFSLADIVNVYKIAY